MSLTSTAVATIALAVAMTSTAARALTLITPALVPDADGYLYCDVVAESATPIGIVAAIVSRDRATVTEFGSGFRASPAATGDGLYHAEETAGSFDDIARRCTATVTGARRGDVHASLTAFDANGVPIATVEARY